MSRNTIGKLTTAFVLSTLLGTSAWAVPIAFETGTYHLGNHPDGNAAPPTYGARIDNLHGAGVFTFDFECVGCNMEMTYNGTTISISGTAFGGHDGGGARIDDDFDGMYAFNMSYSVPEVSDVVENGGAGDGDGLQDIGRSGEIGAVIGSLEFLDAGAGIASMWELEDKAGSHPASLRLGNEDNDLGHRGYVGISGWGWLMVKEVSSGEYVNGGAHDWLFVAQKRSNAPAPGVVSLMLIGLAAIATRRKRN